MSAIYVTDREFLQKVKDKTDNLISKQTEDVNRYFTKGKINEEYKFTSVQSLSRVRRSATPWITARQTSLSRNIN